MYTMITIFNNIMENWSDYMRQKLERFMYGRYGTDQLSRFLLIIILIVTLIASFTKLYVLDIIGLIMFGYLYFRMFSKNISKRYSENEKYMRYQNKITGFFAHKKSELNQRKVYNIYKCPSCKQKVRIPKDKGKVSIKCPKCSTEFVKNSK